MTVATKRKIYAITEETRYGTSTDFIGVPDDIEIEEDTYYFDTKYGEPTIDDVQEQVDRLKSYADEGYSSSIIDDMIESREEWLTEEREREADMERRAQEAEAKKLEEARRVLREAGELPDGDSTTTS